MHIAQQVANQFVLLYRLAGVLESVHPGEALTGQTATHQIYLAQPKVLLAWHPPVLPIEKFLLELVAIQQ